MVPVSPVALVLRGIRHSFYYIHMQWPVTACSKLRVDYNEHQVKLTVSIEAAGAAGKTRKNRKKRNDSESFDCVGGLLAR